MSKIIGVNARLLIQDKLEGIGYVKHEILQRLVKLLPEHTFYFFFDRSFDASFVYQKNIIPVVLSPKARHPILWAYWFEYKVNKKLREIKADVFISLEGFGQLLNPIKSIVLLHDIHFLHYPQHYKGSHQWFYSVFFKRYAKAASKLCSVSAYCQQDIAKQYNIPPKNITVLYNGIRRLPAPSLKHSEHYFFFIGNLNERKNIKRQIQAFLRFKETDTQGLKFYVAGRGNSKLIKKEFKSSKFKDSVVFLGRISDSEYAHYLSGAKALLYVSFLEGFGMPILEAMHFGVPVITSNTSSMPEIGGDAALYCDPEDTEEIAQKMQLVLAQNLREALAQKAKINLKRFSWDDTAQKLKTLLNELVGV